MADSSAGRALRRTGIAFAFILTVFGPLVGVAVYDAGHCRIELQRYRDKYGPLPTEDDE